MIKRLLHLSACILLLLGATLTRAQNLPASFSSDPLKFTQDLGKYIDGIFDKDKRKEAALVMDAFSAAWAAGKFSGERQQKIMEMANLMLKYKMRPMPHYSGFMQALTRFIESGPDDKNFDSWFAILQQSLDKSSSAKFLSFLEITINLFTGNVLYQSSTTTWKSNSSDYTFSYDSVPRIVFPSLTLTCLANGDSSVIANTSGIYYPTVYLWTGEGGTVNWKRAGLPEDQVWAELGKYRIGLRFSKYTADSVTFYNKEYFSRPMLGKLDEKVLAGSTEEKASYPRFSSYYTRLKITEIFKDIDYEGGFTMRGARLFGSGSQTEDACLYFKRDGKVFIRAASKELIIRKDKISCTRASVTIYWEEDSIYHPGLEMKYLDKSRELSMLRTTEGLAMSPYFDTFHKIDMYCEAVYWKMDEPKVDFTMIKGPGGEGNAVFESHNYYRDTRYFRLQGIDEVNPLDLVMGYYRKYGSKEIYLNEFINYVKKPAEQVQAMLINLAVKGFLIYDLQEDKAFIKDRLFEYMNARAKRTDYDVLQFNSTISAQPNATLSLLNFDLKLRGVPKVFLSDSQMVYIYPSNQELTLRKNRDFLFTGRVHAGLFDFFARECSFEYDKFKLNMPTIDSLSFMVRGDEKDEYGESNLIRVKTVIRELSGDLLIDHPNNKSGVTPFPEFPIFNSKNDAYVYYERSDIQGGVYKKNSFFFHVYPFSISNLDRFKTDDIRFEGFLVSARIFPDIEEPLKVQPDYSLGFVRKTPGEGYPVYGGKGTFLNIIDLSHRGLKGNGTLKFLLSTSESDDFTFFPDSTHGVLQHFAQQEQKSGVEYPSVTASDVFEQWFPYRDLMMLTTIDKPVDLYGGEAHFTGNLQLTSASITGAGLVKVADAEMDALLFKFKNRVFDSDTANFRLKTYDLKELAFSTHNYKSHIDFDERKGDFKSNGGGSKVDFPVNQYICYMDEFEWYMDKEEISLSNSKGQSVPEANAENMRELVDIDISGSEFVSVHPKQDSLSFSSPKARYNLRNNIIYAQQVSLIRVADAAIFPDKGKVTIYRAARMDTLRNARVLANTITKFHDLDNAIINIQSRKKYSGEGDYYYTDEKDERQLIRMNRIGVDSTLQTYAEGHISDSLKFRLSGHFDFMGDVRLQASREYLTFKGGYRVVHDCDTVPRAWVRFSAAVNPDEILLPVDTNLRDVSNRQLFASLSFSQRNNHIYPAFLTRKQSFSDQEIIGASGFVRYMADRQEYQIGSMAKLSQRSLPGNFLSLNKSNCTMHGEGKIDLGAAFGQLKMHSFGALDYYIVPDSAHLDLVLTMDFFFADNAMKLMHDALKETNLMAVDLGKDKYKEALAEMMGVKDADEMITEISLYGGVKRIPSEMNQTIVFADVMFKWNPLTNSFVSVGPVGIGNMEKTQVNKFVKGYIEITRKRSGDVLDMYLEVAENNWYYFNYSRGLMQAISSLNEFNTIITELKPDKRTQKGEKGEENYRFIISTLKKKKDFIRRMEGEIE